MTVADVSSAHQGPALLALLCAYGLTHAPLLWLIVVGAARVVANVRLWSSARRTAKQKTSELAPGRVVVAGRVRLLPGQDAAVRVEIDQQGEEQRGSKGRVSHSWTETHRRVTANAFDIELDSGPLLRCEPPDESKGRGRLLLVDELDQEKRSQQRQRTLAAELTPDEHVWAVGQLVERLAKPDQVSSDPYRSAPRLEYTLVSPAGGELLLASEPLARRYGRRVRYYLKWWLLAIASLALLHGGALLGYHLRQAKGVVVAATITGKRYVGGKSKKHYLYLRLPLRRPAGLPARVREDAAKSTFRSVRKGQRVDLLIVPGHAWSRQLGARPSVSWFWLIFLTIGTFSLAGAFAVYRERSRDWWARELVTHHGKGPLNIS
jgi:hypothetical protein